MYFRSKVSGRLPCSVSKTGFYAFTRNLATEYEICYIRDEILRVRSAIKFANTVSNSREKN